MPATIETPAFDAAPATIHTLDWPEGSLQVQALGAMLLGLALTLPGGARIAPLYRAPWHGQGGPGLDDNPLLRHLGGDWLCAPYGPASPPPVLPAGWQARDTPAADPDQGCDHGWAANHAWRLVARGMSHLKLAVDLPAAHALARIDRVFQVGPAGQGIEVITTLHPRRDTVMPLALHPTFALPETGVELRPGPSQAIHTYPVPPVAGVSRLQAGGTGTQLDRLPAAAGGTLDLQHLPLAHDTEELLQLQDCAPPFTLRLKPTIDRARGVDLLIDWDAAVLPDLLLWVSQRGRAQPPWNGRNLALGIEPCASCFDLTRVAVPAPAHPLAHRRGVGLSAGQPLEIRWRLQARWQDQGGPAP